MRRLLIVFAALLAVLIPTAPAAPASAPVINSFLTTHHADVGSSVALGDGRVLWLFGDTVGAAWSRNSAVVQHPDGRWVRRGSGAFMTPPQAGHWYWPGEAVREGNRIYVMAMDFTCPDPCGAWDFQYVRTDVLTYRTSDLRLLSRTVLPRRPSGAMISQLVQARDGYTYAYGSYPVAGQLGKAHEVARVPNGKIACASCWRYLGTKIGPELEAGTVVTVVRRAAGGYRLYTKRLDLWSDEIISYDSATPYGPWTFRRTVALTPQDDQHWTYAVEAHFEQSRSSLVLTYATNTTTCPLDCADYRVTAITLPLP